MLNNMFSNKFTDQLYTYLDKDECLVGNGGCSHVCTNTDGSYSCGCPHGWRLGLDGRTCEGNICSGGLYL